MTVQRFSDAGERRVRALQTGLAVGLLVLAALAVLVKGSTVPSVQWPVLLLVLTGALLLERHRRRMLPSTAGPGVAARAPGHAPRTGHAQRLWGWLQRQISDGVVHGHEEGERCNPMCRRTRPLDEPARACTPVLVLTSIPTTVPAHGCKPGRLGQRGAARSRSSRSLGPRVNS